MTDLSTRLNLGRCTNPDCKKIRYLTRATARRAAKTRNLGRMRAFPCGDYWHLEYLGPKT